MPSFLESDLDKGIPQGRNGFGNGGIHDSPESFSTKYHAHAWYT
jgi:hypothetical protein